MATPCATAPSKITFAAWTVRGEPVAAPASLAGTLRPYQVEGFRWLARLASLGFGGILADEMGLGKTLQMIALVKSLRDSGQLGGPGARGLPRLRSCSTGPTSSPGSRPTCRSVRWRASERTARRYYSVRRRG